MNKKELIEVSLGDLLWYSLETGCNIDHIDEKKGKFIIALRIRELIQDFFWDPWASKEFIKSTKLTLDELKKVIRTYQQLGKDPFAGTIKEKKLDHYKGRSNSSGKKYHLEHDPEPKALADELYSLYKKKQKEEFIKKANGEKATWITIKENEELGTKKKRKTYEEANIKRCRIRDLTDEDYNNIKNGLEPKIFTF
jgi:hypothetical protein